MWIKHGKKSISERAIIAFDHGLPWASYQIRKIAGCACAGNAGNVFPRRRFQRKPIVSDPGMHHGTCVTHVPWCMSGSLTCGDGENVPGIPGACAPAILRIWQEAHAVWKTWPSGLSNDKNLGLRPRFLSTESLGPCFSHGMGDHDQILQHTPPVSVDQSSNNDQWSV